MGARSRTVALVVLCGAALVGASCSRGEALRSEAISASEDVTFETPDGTELEGRLFGPEGATAGVVFAHMAGSDQSAWYVDAARVGDAGYRGLTFNFRGTCPGGDAGCSEGEKEVTTLASDLAAAVAELRSTGVERVGVVGASMGGLAALSLAGTDASGIDTVVSLSAPSSFSGLSVSPEMLSGLTGATLFIAGNGDVSAAAAAQSMGDVAAQPTKVEIVTTDDHGTDLLTGNAGGRVRDAMDLWLGVHLGVEASPS